MNETEILLVTDEKAHVETVRDCLSERKISVSIISSADQALKWLDLKPDTDLVILDVEMRGINALQMLRQMKNSHPLVEVIMLTGLTGMQSAIQGMALGASDYLTKPFALEELLAKAEEAGARKRQHKDKLLTAGARALRGQWET